jgi:predicted  nucleic acid-binding Zn-ribbon protein
MYVCQQHGRDELVIYKGDCPLCKMIEELQEAYDKARSLKMELEGANGRIAELEVEVEDMQGQIDMLEDELKEAKG